MSNLNKFFKQKFGHFYKVFVFLFSVFIIVAIFPQEGKFKYEYQKGIPWPHENLIAPYSFPIYKLNNELKAERDSILKEIQPYFKYDNNVSLSQSEKFAAGFDTAWTKAKFTYDSIHHQNYSRRNPFTSELKEKFFTSISDVLEYIYHIGIVEFTDVGESFDPEKHTIVVLRNNIADEYAIGEVFTLKSSYEYLMLEVKIIVKRNLEGKVPSSEIDEHPISMFFSELQLNQFIVPNLNFDQTTTGKVQQSALNSISLTRGMVQAGEGIIFKGELVDNDDFRILESFRKEYENAISKNDSSELIYLGKFLLIFFLMSLVVINIIIRFKPILNNSAHFTFVMLLIVFIVSITVLTLQISVINLYLIPFALLPIILRTFFSSKLAFSTHVITVLICAYLAPNSFEFVFLQIIAGFVAIISLRNVSHRGQLFSVAGYIIASYCFIYFAIGIMQEGDISKIDWINFLWFGGSGLLLLSSYPMIYIFEKIFGFLSDITLMELSDLNQPLLRQLAEVAPGTFQHSLQVANLAEAAIYQVGGNAKLIRTGALYHDIGKMSAPNFFTENQTHGNNPHDKLEYDKSAEIIINHVTYGVELAKKDKLPEQIIDFIRTHHGTTKTLYFYRSFKNKYPDIEVDESIFTYPGPKPFSKETAVLMMADSVEAASRSLKMITAEKIAELIDNIIDFQIKEKQFDNVNITFQNVNTIKRIFKEKLQNIYHARIEYPKELISEKQKIVNE